MDLQKGEKHFLIVIKKQTSYQVLATSHRPLQVVRDRELDFGILCLVTGVTGTSLYPSDWRAMTVELKALGINHMYTSHLFLPFLGSVFLLKISKRTAFSCLLHLCPLLIIHFTSQHTVSSRL